MTRRFFCSAVKLGQATRIALRAVSLSSAATASSKSIMTPPAPLSNAFIKRSGRVPGTNKKLLQKPKGVSSGFMGANG